MLKFIDAPRLGLCTQPRVKASIMPAIKPVIGNHRNGLAAINPQAEANPVIVIAEVIFISEHYQRRDQYRFRDQSGI